MKQELFNNKTKAEDYQRQPKQLGLYEASHEHDACGVGMLVNIQGGKSHELVESALKVLLCHHPEYYHRFESAGYRLDAIDLILSGHAHGGQMCIFGKPLFAPGQGFFPKLAGGVYDGRLIVSRGLSDTAHTPRINNPMELVMIDITGGNHIQYCE